MQKDNQNKPSFREITPEFYLALAKRMNSNKIQFGGKYEEFNWLESQDLYSEILSLIDAAERHLVDLKSLAMNNESLLNKEESQLDHSIAIACNMMMIWNKIYRYENRN